MCLPWMTASLVSVFTGLFVAKVEHHLSLNWISVFAVLWVALVLIIIFLGYFTEDQIEGGGGIWVMFIQIFFLAFTVLLPIKLDHPNFNISWYYVFSMLWASCLLALTLDKSYPDFKYKFSRPIKKLSYKTHLLVLTKYNLLALIAFSVLILLNLEKVISTPWHIIFLPLYITDFVYVMVCLSFLSDRKTEDVLFYGIYSILLYLPVIAFELSIQYYLSGKIAHFALACIPLYLVEAVFIIAGIFLPCLIYSLGNDD